MAARGRSGRCRPRTCLLAFLATLSISHATDTLKQGDSLGVSQTLVSAGGGFQLGFFSTKDGSNGIYVGIRYRNITDPTVVWLANRDKPLTDTSAALTVDSSGSLVVLDGKGRSVTVLMQGSGKGSSNLTLLDSGNLVLRAAGSEQVLWQSFDYPTDTWLPGMKLGREGKLNRMLTSWRGPTDPSPGDFLLQADGPRLRTSRKGIRLWESQYSALFSSGKAADDLNLLANLSYVNESKVEEAYLVYSTSTLFFTRIVMDVEGQLKLWTWAGGEWMHVWAAPAKHSCEVPDYCGPNGVCSNATDPPCGCLPGFMPKASSEWASNNWSVGCVRKVGICGAPDEGLLLLSGYSQPPVLYTNYRGNSTDSIFQGCRDQCIADCNCVAYALAYGMLPGCFMWFGRLWGLQARENNFPNTELYVRLSTSVLDPTSNAAPPSKKPDDAPDSRKRRLLIALLASFFAGVLPCGVGLCCFLRRKRLGEQENGEELLLRDIGMNGAVTYRFVDVSEDGGERGPEICVYSFSNVLAATNNFSDDNKLGEGGFGPVYKGKLPNEQEIAIKRLSTRSGQGLDEFKTEILLIARLQHKNLVRLLGCCIHGEERLLIYEYMPNKSLDFFLFDPQRAAQLDWGRRIQIIEGTAQGLLYLHKYSRLTIIHRDLKPSNILLDNHMNPKISDFGLARTFSSNEDQASTTNRIVGTYGYMSPEYAMEGLFSIKSDVFSFGVLLLEIVSGRKSIGSHHYFSIPRSLLGYAWELWNAGRELELTDPSLQGSWPAQEVSRCIYVGLMCVQECADDRPTMAEVVTMLAGGSSTQQAPKQPAFLTVRHTTQKSCSPDVAAASATNEMTISAVEGR